jgi:hypothetical protein
VGLRAKQKISARYSQLQVVSCNDLSTPLTKQVIPGILEAQRTNVRLPQRKPRTNGAFPSKPCSGGILRAPCTPFDVPKASGRASRLRSRRMSKDLMGQAQRTIPALTPTGTSARAFPTCPGNTAAPSSKTASARQKRISPPRRPRPGVGKEEGQARRPYASQSPYPLRRHLLAHPGRGRPKAEFCPPARLYRGAVGVDQLSHPLQPLF